MGWMRIIAGEFRGRRLLPPEGDVTRPITDRAKQSLFDVLAPHIPGSLVYDCFSGTGSMGLECLSRGASRAAFFDADRSAIQRLQQNIQALNVRDRCQVIPGNLFKWFASQPAPDRKADLIFLDPPYRFVRERRQELTSLAGRMAAHLTPAGLVVFRHDAADVLALPPLHTVDQRTYGQMAIDLLGHAAPPASVPHPL